MKGYAGSFYTMQLRRWQLKEVNFFFKLAYREQIADYIGENLK